jgi:magnesium transporter
MITHYYKPKETAELETIGALVPNAWTHVVEPTAEELEKIIAEFDLDEAIVADIKDNFEVPRFEHEGSVSYFFTRFLDDDNENDTDTSPILIILGNTFIITIANEEVPFLRTFVSGKKSLETTERTHLFLEIMTSMVANYERFLNTMRKSVQRDVGRIRNIGARDIQRFVLFEQELNEILAALLPTNTWLHQLTKGNYIQMFNEDRELLEDLLIASSQIVDSAKAILKTIQNIRSANESILTQKLNTTIRMLTAFTIILTIPTLIASLFGMNVPIPLQENPFGFWVILGIIIVIIAVTIHFFTKNRWI